MENNIKQNDWFAARLLNSDKGVEVLVEEGINPLNSTLQPADFYKNKNKVKEAFKTESGAFDETKFNEVYNKVANEYEYLSNVDTENFILDYYEKSESDFTTPYGKVKDPKVVASFTPNPLEQSKGVTIWNKWSDPKISQREAAQNNQYYDPDTKTWSSETLNELGATGLLNEDALAYATWDDDGKHIDPMTKEEVLHRKGEWKTDEFGNYYAEKVGNKESLNKQFVTWSEVLTDDSGPWNKIDIFDSDSLNSNIPKSVFRAAATVAGMSIPYFGIGSTIIYATAATNLLRALPQITKTLTSLFSEDVQFDSLNKWDNYMRKFGQSKSDYAQEHFFSLENVIDLAADSFAQLKQQRAIAEIPKRLGMMKEASAAAEKATMATLMSADPSKVKYLTEHPEVLKALAKTNEGYRNAEKMFEQASKLSTAISRAYLITTSTEDTYNMSRSYGFDKQTSSLISLATYAGIGTLFQTDYFRGILYNTPDYELKRNINAMVKSYLDNNAKTMAKELTENVEDNAKKNLFKSWGNKIVSFFKEHVSDVKSGQFGIVSGAIGEGAEEVSEEMTQDAAIQLGKGWNELKSLFTGKEYKDSYTYSGSDPLSRYGTALFGGLVGGAIFKMSDRFMLDKSAYKSWREMLGNNSEISKEFVTYISQGKANLILKSIDDLQKTPMISTELSAFDDSVVAAKSADSKNAVLFGSLKKSILDLDTFMNNYNLKIDYDRFKNIELVKGLRAAWINDEGLQDSLFQDYLTRTNEIAQLHANLEELRGQILPNMEASKKIEIEKNITDLQSVLDDKIVNVRKLVNGEDDSYIGRLMLQSNKDILDRITPKTKEAISQNMYKRSYDSLPKYLQDNVIERIKSNKESGKTELDYVNAWTVFKDLASDDKIKGIMSTVSEDAKHFDPRVFNQQVENGIVKAKPIDIKDGIINDDLYRTLCLILDINTEFGFKNLTAGQRANMAYHLLGLTQVMPKMYGGTEIFDVNAEWMKLKSDEFKDVVYSFFNQIRENSKNLSKRLSESKDPYSEKATNMEKYILETFANDETIDEVEKRIIEVIESSPIYSKTEDDDYASLDPFPTFEITTFSSVLDTILSKINPKKINIAKFLEEEKKKAKLLGNQYIIDGEVEDAIKDIEDSIHLFEALNISADSNFSSYIDGVPFGANNFINKAFKEKGIDLELLQADGATIQASVIYGNSIQKSLAELRETSNLNKGAVITLDKNLSINRSHAKLMCIQNFLNSNTLPTLFKDFFNDFSVTLHEVNNLKTDEDYVSTGIDYRNQLNKFESIFYKYFNSVDQDGKKEIINNIVSYLSNNGQNYLYLDASSVSAENEVVYNEQDFLWFLMSCTFSNSAEINAAYKEIVDESDDTICPFDSQEEVIIGASKFVLQNSTQDDIILWTDAIHDSYKDVKDAPTTILSNAVKSICSGGVGKTSAIIPYIYRIINKVNPKKMCIFAANNVSQITSLKEVLGNSITANLINEIIENTSDEQKFKDTYENKTVIIDEATNISQSDLNIIDELCKKYNVKVIYFGDTKQHGIANNIDYVVAYSTPQLEDSKRASTDISRRNSKFFEQLFQADKAGIQRINTGSLPELVYYESDSDLEGIKVEGNNTVLTQDYIDNFFTKYHIDPNAKVLIVTKNISELAKNNFNSKYPNLTFESDISKIQGLEWDYVITDLDLTYSFDGKGNNDKQDWYNFISELKDFYTLFSRHKHGLISMKPIQITNVKSTTRVWKMDSSTGNNIKSKFKPIVSGLTPEAIKSFKEYKLKVLNGTDAIQDEIKKKEATVAEAVTQGTENNVDIPVTSSIAQATPGFLLKNEFTDDFIKNLGITQNEYFIARNQLYNALTMPDKRSNLLAGLPKVLQGGQFRIKVQYNKTEDLYNLGNKGRDNKDLNGNHPWIVYSVIVNGKNIDITLGMFHNATTSHAGGLSGSKALDTINKLYGVNEISKVSKPLYYKIDFNKVNFSRSTNAITIQSQVTSDSDYINITYNNGSFSTSSVIDNTKAYSLMNTTAAFYFKKGDQTVVAVNDILEELDKLKTKYTQFYEKAIKGNVYANASEYDDIIELLSYDRLNGLWKAKSVPDLEGRFCSFVTLNTETVSSNIKENLHEKSSIYLAQIKNKNAQMNIINDILNDTSIDNKTKKEKIKTVLNSHLLWNVSVLTYDYSTVNDENTFNNIIDGLSITKVQGSGRSLSAYNIAVTHQFGLLLYRFAYLTKNKFTFKGKVEKYYNEDDESAIHALWNSKKDALITAYNTWNPKSNGESYTENELLDFLEHVSLLNASEAYDNSYFYNSKYENLLQSDAFKDFLRTVYISDNVNGKWSKIITKTNGLKYMPAIKHKDFKVIFAGHLYPEVIADNKISISPNGDELTITQQVTLPLKSKVVQLPQIWAYIDNDIDETSFENDNELINQANQNNVTESSIDNKAEQDKKVEPEVEVKVEPEVEVKAKAIAIDENDSNIIMNTVNDLYYTVYSDKTKLEALRNGYMDDVDEINSILSNIKNLLDDNQFVELLTSLYNIIKSGEGTIANPSKISPIGRLLNTLNIYIERWKSSKVC